MRKLPNIYIVILRYCFLTFAITQFSVAQDEYQPYISQSFLIISSSTDFDSAEKIALQAQEELGLEYTTSAFYPDKSEGFKTDKVCNCGEIHEYFPRGSHDNGDYVSIEYSNGYEGFTEGYYIVIVSSGSRKDVAKNLRKVKKHFEQAYIKDSEIYVGCRH